MDGLTTDDCDTIIESLGFSLDKIRNHDYLQGQPRTHEQYVFYEGVRRTSLSRLQDAMDSVRAYRRALKSR
jgi:hypothetical protein